MPSWKWRIFSTCKWVLPVVMAIDSAVKKFWSRRPHRESRRQAASQALKASFLRGSGGMPPKKILKFRCLGMLFSTFSRQYLGLRAAIFYVKYNRSFPQNLNHWLLEKSEMINLQMLIQKNTFSVLSLCCPFQKNMPAMSALVSLAQTPFWHRRKPGI